MHWRNLLIDFSVTVTFIEIYLFEALRKIN